MQKEMGRRGTPGGKSQEGARGLGRKPIFRYVLFQARGRKLSSLQKLGRESSREGVGGWWGLCPS